MSWRGPAVIATACRLADRSTIYRHANAFGLFAKRQRNIRAALERIIEQAGDVDVTAASVFATVQAYTKINAAGQWIERSETVSLNDLFGRMTQEEREARARNDTLPDWFPQSVIATATDSQGD